LRRASKESAARESAQRPTHDPTSRGERPKGRGSELVAARAVSTYNSKLSPALTRQLKRRIVATADDGRAAKIAPTKAADTGV